MDKHINRKMLDQAKIWGFTDMKKLMAIIISMLIVYIIYYDLRVGTLPLVQEETKEAHAESVDNLITKTYVEMVVNPGDTVISIIEKNENTAIKVPIAQIIEDFKSLNQNISPEKIQIGKTYKFPTY